ncbi:MAG TPA: hypothetical protein GXX53_09290 [Tissierellia bacterium]|nr:hypothetical protein [Tissierellia bacterium]
MTATLTIQDLFRLILYLLGIGALVYIIVLIKNLNNAITGIKNILNRNEKEIDTTIKQLPYIAQNINSISEEAKNFVKSVSPEAEKLVSNASSLSEKLDNTSSKVFNAINEVSESICSTATTIEHNIKNANDYIELIMDIIGIIKSALNRKK